MDKSYLIETNKLNDQYQKYLKDFDLIFRESFNTGKDVTTYVLRILKNDNNPEIGKALIESAFGHHLTTLGIIKVIVKILYVTGHIQAYRYGAYHQLKGHIDETLKKTGGNKSELVQKKYPLLLARLNEEKIAPKTNTSLGDHKITDKAVAEEDIVENINRQYINFVRKP